jgi:gliding motility-associated lipoprotein GldH
MRKSVSAIGLLVVLLGCDSNRLFEQNVSLLDSNWIVSEKPSFKFRIRDTGKQYNMYCNIRNNSSYPYARFFFSYALKDSIGTVLNTNLKTAFLFDVKTGKPMGNSGIGDVFDHQIPVLTNFQFKYAGTYTLEFEQSMRLDTLMGISAVGARVEEVIVKQ